MMKLSLLIAIVCLFSLDGFYGQDKAAAPAAKETPDVTLGKSKLMRAEDLIQLQRYREAKSLLDDALSIFQKSKDRTDEGKTDKVIGNFYLLLTNYLRAIEFTEQYLEISKELKDTRGESEALNILGTAYFSIGQYSKSINYLQQSLEITNKTNDLEGKKDSFYTLGSCYFSLNQFAKSADYYDQALSASRELKDKSGEQKALIKLSSSYQSFFQYAKSIDCLEQALIISRVMKDKLGERIVLNKLGTLYFDLGLYSKSKDYVEKALSIASEIQDKKGQSECYSALGIYSNSINQYNAALQYFSKALNLNVILLDRIGEENAYFHLGNTFALMRQPWAAATYFRRALALAQTINDKLGEEMILANLGHTIGDYRKDYNTAIQMEETALKIAGEINDRLGQSIEFYNIMDASYKLHNATLAIFMGKQAVNIIQSIRAENTNLQKEYQQSYLKGNELTYDTLANILIEQGRIPEAQQVIKMLKEDEFFGYIRRDAGSIPLVETKLYLNTDELAILKEYSLIANKITAIGVEYNGLLRKSELTLTEITRRDHLGKQLTIASKAFELFLKTLETRFANKSELNKKKDAFKDSQNLIDALKDIGNNCVVVYSLMTEDHYLAIVTTEGGQVAREYEISKVNLRKKIAALIDVLKNPRLDPRPLSQELYKILIGPIEKDLEQANAKSIAWELDDTLRYLPMDALYDGKQYMIEKYAQSVITPASNVNIKDKPAASWSALGLGVTKKHEHFVALPNVADELIGIVKNSKGDKGVLDGQVLLDEKFTQTAMLDNMLLKHPSVIHIASHFNFVPGSEEDSFLLLGDGKHYTLADVKNAPQMFHGVDMLTLSACDTAVGGERNGKEIEGFGVIAQRQGAMSLLASLWSVDDASTSILMQQFYRLHQSSGLSRVEALRQAQLALLHGEIKLTPAQRTRRGLRPLDASMINSLTDFKEDPNAPFAHPYYWAPFILIGNWR